MDGLGFRPVGSTTQGAEQVSKEQYIASMRTLSNFKTKFLEVKIDYREIPKVLEAYLRVKDGKEKGIIPEDTYKDRELERMKKIIEPFYQKAKNILQTKFLDDYSKDLQSRISNPTSQADAQDAREKLQLIPRDKELLKKLTSIDDLAKPEFRSARNWLNDLLITIGERQQAGK